MNNEKVKYRAMNKFLIFGRSRNKADSLLSDQLLKIYKDTSHSLPILVAMLSGDRTGLEDEQHQASKMCINTRNHSKSVDYGFMTAKCLVDVLDISLETVSQIFKVSRSCAYSGCNINQQ